MTDPLGLTPEQCLQSDSQQLLDSMADAYERNLKLISDLPPGTMVQIQGFRAMTREQFLEVYF